MNVILYYPLDGIGVLSWGWGIEQGVGSTEGLGVSSVASREMAAGLPALSAMVDWPREPMAFRAMDRSRRGGRLLRDRLGHGQARCPASAAGTTILPQKHAGIRFGGKGAPCYPWSSMGAEGA